MSIPPYPSPCLCVARGKGTKGDEGPLSFEKSTKYQEVEGSHPEENYEWSSRQHSSTN